jgi:hypothetical protein
MLRMGQFLMLGTGQFLMLRIFREFILCHIFHSVLLVSALLAQKPLNY